MVCEIIGSSILKVKSAVMRCYFPEPLEISHHPAEEGAEKPARKGWGSRKEPGLSLLALGEDRAFTVHPAHLATHPGQDEAYPGTTTNQDTCGSHHLGHAGLISAPKARAAIDSSLENGCFSRLWGIHHSPPAHSGAGRQSSVIVDRCCG